MADGGAARAAGVSTLGVGRHIVLTQHARSGIISPNVARVWPRGRGTMQDWHRIGEGVARRGLLAGAAALVAGVLAKASERVAQGANGDVLTAGGNFTETTN